MPPRTVALIGAVCLTTGWLLASVLTPPVARVQVLPERSPVQPQSDAEALAPFAQQLPLGIGQQSQPPTPRRNPFEFAARQRVSGASTPQQAATRPIEIPVAPVVVGPIFSLSGIGARSTPAGVVHTAVLSDRQTVHLVKAGDAIGGYQVIAVTENSVTLGDASGAEYLLRLKP